MGTTFMRDTAPVVMFLVVCRCVCGLALRVLGAVGVVDIVMGCALSTI